MDFSDQVIRARAPLRLGLAGGGTDLSPYCDDFGGAVLNVTINRYAFASIEPSPDGRIHFIARDVRIDESFDVQQPELERARLKLHAGVLHRIVEHYASGIYPAVTVRTMVDAPMGSGLGSSSALIVALVEAFRAFYRLPLGAYDVAHLAFEIERIDLNLAGGKQDQYAAAFGGLNFIEFLPNDRVIVNPLRVPRQHATELEMSLITCFSGVSRSSDTIIAEQQRGMVAADKANLAGLHQLKRDAIEMKQALLRGEIEEMAEILNRSWLAKKQTAAGISTGRIEELVEFAMAHGALGAKVSGAGGGGFLMFIVAPHHRYDVLKILNEAGAMATGADFTTVGAEAWTPVGKATRSDISRTPSAL